MSFPYFIILTKNEKKIYRVIHKSLREFRHLRYSSRDGHAEGEHVNRGSDTPVFCPTLQVLDMPIFGDAADVNHLIKFLPHTCNVCDRNLITRLTCSPSTWPSWLLYRRGRKSRRDLWITLYMKKLALNSCKWFLCQFSFKSLFQKLWQQKFWRHWR